MSFFYSSHKGEQNCKCFPEFAASRSACSFDLGRAPVLRPEDELSYLWVELFHSCNSWKNNLNMNPLHILMTSHEIPDKGLKKNSKDVYYIL